MGNRLYSFLKNKKFLVATIVLWMLFTCSMILTYETEWKTAMSKPMSILEEGDVNETAGLQVINLEEDQWISQSIKMISDRVTGFSFYIDAEEESTDGILDIKLYDDERLIYEWEYDISQMRQKGFFDFCLPEALEVEKGEMLTVQISVRDAQNTMPKAVVTEKEKDSSSVLVVDGGVTEQIVPFKILNGDHSALKYFALAMYIGLSACLIIIYLMFAKEKRPECLFGSFALCLGVVYLFILPPFVVPDEPSHFVTAYMESSKLLGEEETNAEGKIIVSSDTLWGQDERQASSDTYVQYMKGAVGESSSVESKTVTRAPLTSTHPGYLPQILGISLARIIGLNSEQLLLLGRLFALMLYCFLMYVAIKHMPFGKTFLFIIGTLPMTMQQVVSYSYDSLLLGVCFLTFSLLLEYIYTEKVITWHGYVVLGLATVVIASVKFVYLPLLGIALLIPSYKFGSLRKKIAGAAGIVSLSMTTILLTRLSTIQKAAGGATQLPEAAGGGTRITIDYCLQNISSVIEMFYRTLEQQISRWLSGALASPLGWLEISLPDIVIIGFLFVLLLCICKSRPFTDRRVLAGSRVYPLFLFVLMTGAIMFSMLLDWTPMGSMEIQGVQGRYFIPFLPLILLILDNNLIILQKNIEKYLVLFSAYLHCQVALCVTLTVISR